MSTNPQNGSQPTVVLVHGGFADASSWNDVVERLQAEGVQVTAPANPLRGISIDSAYINSFLDQIPGPRSEEHTSELQSRQYLVCRLLLEKKKSETHYPPY